MPATKQSKIDVDIRPHPSSPDHKRVIVTTSRGYSYACSWAEPFPDEATVREAWKTNRADFMPFNS